MRRLSSTAALLLLFAVNAAAQDEEATDGGRGEDTEYYVVDDPDDDWPDQPMDEQDYANDEQPADPDGDPASAGVREPPGLPLLEGVSAAQPTISTARRSFGGTEVLDGTAPWQAQIYYPSIIARWQAKIAAGTPAWALQHYCGGALIAPGWVLTAHHCIDDSMRQAGYRIRLASERLDYPGNYDYKIAQVIPYAGYKRLEGGDIALIRFVDDRGIGMPSAAQARPISISRGYDPVKGDNVTAYGWGRTRDRSGPTNSIMLKVPLKILDRPTCDQARVALIDLRVVCAAAPGHKTCSNDSGGPLVNERGQLVGIVSAGGEACADDGVPGVYTRVASYLGWITQNTGGAVR